MLGVPAAREASKGRLAATVRQGREKSVESAFVSNNSVFTKIQVPEVRAVSKKIFNCLSIRGRVCEGGGGQKLLCFVKDMGTKGITPLELH